MGARDVECLRAFRACGGITPEKTTGLDHRVFCKFVHVHAKRCIINLKDFRTFGFSDFGTSGLGARTGQDETDQKKRPY